MNRLDRIFWTALHQCWSRWAEVLIIVQPETVVGWHRTGFALYWRWRPKITEQVRVLIRRMADENPNCGAPKIHGELQKLGFGVSERTVARYLQCTRRRRDPGKQWLAFLQNHEKRLSLSTSSLFRRSTFDCSTASSLSSTPVVRSCISMSRGTRPGDWVVQQLRDTFPEAGSHRYVVLDRDAKFDDSVTTILTATGLTAKRTGGRALPRLGGLHHRYAWREAA